jgi:3-oxoadipate enol-lactonase
MAYVRTRLGRWFFEEAGKAVGAGDAACVLLPSLLCDGDMWRGQVGPLAELGRVVVIDGPGHGKSDVPPPFTLEEHARALVDAFDELGISRAVTVGLSWGGMVAMRLALYRPERLAAMAILDSSADATTLRERVEYRLLCSLTRRYGLPPVLSEKIIVPLMFSERARKRAPALAAEFMRASLGFSRDGVTRAATAVSIDRPSILDLLGTIAVPTLVGCGEEDAATPVEHSKRIAARIRGAKLVTFAGLGHLSALEDPALVNAAIVPFVREHLPARA